MAGKKAARQRPHWGSSPRGRRRVRPRIREAADRELVRFLAMALAVVAGLVALGRWS